MKKLLAITTLLCLCIACLAEGGDLSAIARSRGFEPNAAPDDSGALCCDFSLTDNTATVTWTDAGQRYAVSGDAAALARLYQDGLALGDWTSCRYSVDGEVQFSFAVDSIQRFDTLEAYAARAQTALALLVSATGLSGLTETYVLNRRSKKFHHPDCSGIRDMNPKNREDFSGTREEVIAMGYSPCGICKP